MESESDVRDKHLDDIVISGISCRLPESDNMQEFRDNLMNGVDMVTDDDRRWKSGILGLPKRTGKIKDISKFDATVFGVHPKQSNYLDPQTRMLLEVTYEAIVDAGVDPSLIRGSNTGVFVGAQKSESMDAWTAYHSEGKSGYTLTGTTMSMISNRLSYSFDFKGPSYTLGTACSSTLYAFANAMQSIKNGECDAAVVGGVALNILPELADYFTKLGMTSPDGKCKHFDNDADGYVRSDGITAVYLQKKKDAKRVYCTAVHAKTNSDGHKSEGILVPSAEVQKQLLIDTYKDAGISPLDVTYIEAHGTGTQIGDQNEAKAIGEVMCKDRNGPLLIGSVKTNMGHSESAAAGASLAKVIIVMEEKVIPANLHFNTPNKNIPELHNGQLHVVNKNTEWKGGYTAVNSFGFGGSNSHVILKPNDEAVIKAQGEDKLRLFVYGSRSKEGLEEMLKVVQRNSTNFYFHALLNETAKVPTEIYPYRGYTVLNSGQTEVNVKAVSAGKRPVWFVFSGMGSQWKGMGRDMMEIDVFRESIMKSAAILEPYNIKLYDILIEKDEDMFTDVVNSFVGILSVQIALIDLLKCVGISPDGIIGHSVGEVACAYADGCLPAKEAILTAYWRGTCIQNARLPPGSMAAVGLTWEEAKAQCPQGVVPACHNAEDSITISGPADDVRKFVTELQAKDVFAKMINSNGIAFHSYFMKDVAEDLKKVLEKVITPKPRTNRWISSSFSKSEWSSDMAKMSSADYHVHNFVSPVLFREAISQIPEDAVVIEVAPHSLLLPVLKRSLNANCCIVGLMKRNTTENVKQCLSSLGTCYQMGINLDPLKMFPPAAFPVPAGTPMISPLIKWDHSQSWEVPRYQANKSGSGFDIDLTSEDHYLVDHKTDGQILLPGASLIMMVWKAVAEREGKLWKEMPVMFEDFTLHRGTYLTAKSKLHFDVELIRGTSNFQVIEKDIVVASGKVMIPDSKQTKVFFNNTKVPEKLVIPTDLTPEDVYKDFRLKGYEYGPSFQGLLGANMQSTRGVLKWTENWMTFIDTVTQLAILSKRGLWLPLRYKTIVIDPGLQMRNIVQLNDGSQGVECFMDYSTLIRSAGGVYIYGTEHTLSRRKIEQKPLHEVYTFIPYTQSLSASDCGELVKYTEDVSSYAKSALIRMAKQELSLDDIALKKLVTASSEECFTLNNQKTKAALKDSNNMEECSSGFLNGFSTLFTDKDFDEKTYSNLDIPFNKQRLDLLFGNLLQTQYLKHCVDIVSENLLSVNFRVAVIGSLGMIKSVTDLLSAEPLFHLSCTVVSDGPVSKDDDVAERVNKQDIVVWTPDDDVPEALRGSHLVIVSHALRKYKNLGQALKSLSELLDEGGYLLVHEVTTSFHIAVLQDGPLHDATLDFEDLNSRSCSIYCDREKWRHIFAEEGFTVVQEISDNLLSSFFLLKKKVNRRNKFERIVSVRDGDFTWVPQLKLALEEMPTQSEDKRIWLRADDDASGILGLVQCLRKEPGGGRIRCLFNMDKHHSIDNKTEEALAEKDLVMNIQKNGEWGSYRHLPLKPAEPVRNEYAYINIQNRGDLSSLKWFQSSLMNYSPTNAANMQLCDVHYASLNFRDIMLASGKLSADAIPGHSVETSDCLLGLEFAGTDERNNRVMGIVQSQGIATKVAVREDCLWPVPEGWSLEQAATVPVVYFTAYYALIVRARMSVGDSVLIHSGSGGVGQAAITLAIHHGCKIFTTVGSRQKREYLQKRFPELDEKSIFSSRDTAFERGILVATAGKGVDIVLNSLAEEKLQSSVRVLAEHGHFLEIGKFDLSQNNSLGMSAFLKNITFHGILTDALVAEGNREMIMTSKCLTDGIMSGVVKPLETSVFSTDQVEDAFRYMAQGKHVGKVLIKVGDDNRPVCLPALPRTYFKPEKTYVITGGLGGFGLELASWMIDRGARRLILTSRSGKIKTGYQAKMLKDFSERGAIVSITSANVCDFHDTEVLLQSSHTPIGGIFHLAVVLEDSLFENQTVEKFESVCGPKVNGVKNLDQLTRQTCKNSLDWFVVFSSIASGRGNAGQSNYGLANSTMERVCEQRVQDGLPGLAIQWGPIGDVGVFMDTVGDNETVLGGTVPQRLLSCLQSLDALLTQKEPVVSSFVPAEKESNADRKTSDSLMQTICKVMGIKDQSRDANTSFVDLGMDSLINIEIKVILETDFNINLSSKEIEKLTLNKLQLMADGNVSNNNQEETEQKKVDKITAHMMKEYLEIPIPTKIITKLNDIVSGVPLFIVHHLYGTLSAMERVVSQLKVPAYGVMRTAEVPQTPLTDMALCYVQAIKEFLNKGEAFHLAGYSYGGVVVQEMALRFQDIHSPPLSLILLDGSKNILKVPEDIRSNRVTVPTPVKLFLAGMGLDVDLIRAYCIMKVRNTEEERKSDQRVISTQVNEKAKRLKSLLQELGFNMKTEDVKKFVMASLISAYALEEYEPDQMYRGNVTLVSAAVTVKTFEAKGLNKYTTGEITGKIVSGHHLSFLSEKSGDEVADIINRTVLP